MWQSLLGSASTTNTNNGPPVLAQTSSSASSATTVSMADAAPASSGLTYTYKVQIFPHRENAQIFGAIPGQSPLSRFHFEPVERDLRMGSVLKIGRRVDKKVCGCCVDVFILCLVRFVRGEGVFADSFEPTQTPVAPIVQDTSPEDVAMGEEAVDVPVLPNSYQSTPGQFMDRAVAAASSTTTPAEPHIDFIAFKSKVVSRTHAELWVSDDGKVMFKDVGSSSGTWVNKHRLSPSGKESRAYALKSGDVIQLGIDYQGRQEDVYKSVVMKIFVTIRSKDPPKPNPLRLKHALRALLSSMNPSSESSDSTSCTDCCICLSALSPLQTLFLAPCSHCFHFRCVMPLLGSSVLFQCPLCRQVANLEKGVGEDEESLIDGEAGSGGNAAVGEASLEEWLGALRLEGQQANEGAGADSNGAVVSAGASNGRDDGQVLNGLQNALDGILPELDANRREEVLELFKKVLETQQRGSN
ncbi:hypothetical protein HDU77_003527 [Chytriomyces hyalinus]|nr:hypothetical protein HDU77_003527 [Chytriomyces hyalinus]